MRRAETIYVEKPLRAHRRCAGLTFELDGVADVVLAEADGSWHIIELKITFAPLTAATRDRYRTQVAMYGHLLERYVDGEVTTAVEALGVDRDSLHPEATSEAISEILSRFL
jgi:hypothetical protein